MRELLAYPSPALACLALALVTLPPPPARRRCAALFGPPVPERKVLSPFVLRVAVPLIPLSLWLVGFGTMLAAAVLAATLAVRHHRGRHARRHAAELAHLLDGLEVIIGELRVGAHPSAAAEIAARETAGDTSHAFAVSAARSRLGGSGASGLRQPNSAIAHDLSRVADAWQVAESHGLALAELLTAARTDLLGRKRFQARTRAALAGAHATAAVLSALPLLGLALGHLMGAAPLHILLTTPPGQLLLPLGTTLTCTGLLWTDAITRKVLR
ncbi:type II secretion system F family protein [Nocardia otitidiscaviarum]|uniref:type II secretion system F family protein n=1 Tax=Nocardia otitidiscaviarum TaxID=1823 RepID=UPI001895F118|nr:type II secretion system F family protein [Nocardia otitidiscaviarum]MBF6236308.1 type II secretion system F family protein [Nocardia otitidiscaviarum]